MGFSKNKTGAVAKCPLMEANNLSKQQRYEERKKIIEKGKNSKNPSVVESANRLEKQNNAVERAKLSDHVYKSDQDPPPPAPEGWAQLSDDELAEIGLDKEDLVDPNTGLKAAIYKSDFEVPSKTVIAFAGTESRKDIEVDVIQGVGLETKQYNQAMELTGHLSATLGPNNVESTGHSLGGGLASAGSATSGCKATTFNSAGLSPKTAKRLHIDPETQAEREKGIDAYNSSNDPLSIIQDSVLTPGMNKAVGNRMEVPPAPKNKLSWKDKIRNPIQSALTGHGSSNIVENIEHQKLSDVNIILS